MRILHWFRKDLRLDDNTALSAAAHDATRGVVPFYTSDPTWFAAPDMAPTRVRFVLDSLAELAGSIERCGSRLALAHGDPVETVVAAARAAGADAVSWNDEYEPELRARDERVAAALTAAGIGVRRTHDRLIVPPGAVQSGSGTPYTVYTPFRKACEGLPIPSPHAAVKRLAPHDLPTPAFATLARLGLSEPTSSPWPAGESNAHARLERFLAGGLARYGSERDYPSAPAVSQLSADLKFGTIGIRRVAHAALDAAQRDDTLVPHTVKFVQELRWRDFFAHVLWHFPHVAHGAFRPEYDALRWRGTDAGLAAWAEGRTGYPIVDAGMRELLATGLMHNRVRMIVASFLTKDLLVDWRRGERWFMQHLVDGDLASNNGGWQWAAGTGTDAAPYFRIFNPVTQGMRFDAAGLYVRRWCPELTRLPDAHLHAPWEAPPLVLVEAGVTLGETYPFPVVDHAVQREQALAMYAEVKGATAKPLTESPDERAARAATLRKGRAQRR
ncbi:MAG: cryptochrome/photolyase family protein [bacterium]